MTSRSKNAVRSFETEIEKSREESNWKKVVDLATQLKTRSPQHESLAHFLIGEGKLEAHLEEWPPIKENIERAQRELTDARGYLTLATDESGKKAGVALDSHLLLGKLHFACGAYEDALKHFKLAELNTLTEKELPIRSLRIVAESYAIKGLCLEETAVPGSSKYKQVERDSEMIRSFEISSELTLLYLQRGGATRGVTLDAALHKAAALQLRVNRPDKALERYRILLSACECANTASLRSSIARQLAELLVSGAARPMYKPPERPPVPAQSTLSRRRDEYYSEGPWKPKRYAAINQFVPAGEREETILVLIVGEALAARDAVLSQSAEWQAARDLALRHATAIVDLLAIVCVRYHTTCLLTESLERAMKFSFGCAHVWKQRALAAAAAADTDTDGSEDSTTIENISKGTSTWREAVKAEGVLVHAQTLNANNAALALVAAKLRYRMGKNEEGIELAEEALSIEQKQNGPLLARCHLYTGIGYQRKAQRTNARPYKASANEKCLEHLLSSVQVDTNDHLAYYHLALQHMLTGMLNEAMDAVRSALRARICHVSSLVLLCALCSSAAPRRLLAAHLPLQRRAALAPPQEGLSACKELLAYLYSPEAETQYALVNGYHDDAHSDKDAAGSFRAESSRIVRSTQTEESRALQAVTSPLALQRAKTWRRAAQIFLQLGRVGAAAGCVAEAAAISPHCHLVLHTRGLVHMARGEWDQARICLQDALAVNPTHLDTMLELGMSYYWSGFIGLAERVLRAACAIQPRRADTWRRLALVLAAREQWDAAADAAAAAAAADVTCSADEVMNAW